ncbi:MAG: nucleotidyltransferase family protein [Candidatus Aureabacteria bacterium]|nr:nucleotidyltransferase family protein [Candidatus Auribacterota bacterium]
MTKQSVTKIMQDNMGKIRAYGVARIGVFGSFSQSVQNNRSDIDILIEFRKGQKKFDNYMDLKFLLEKLFHRRVDLVMKDTLKPGIKRHVMREVIYARV